MAFTIQTDDGLTDGSNSYSTVQEFIDYWLDRGVDYSTAVASTIEASLVKGLEYVDTRNKYKGSKLNGRTQSTEFPRKDFYDEDYELIEGVPIEAKHAQMEYAQREQEGTTLQGDGSSQGAVKSERKKVDVIEKEVEYFTSGQDGDVIAYPTADNKIPDYFIANGGGFILNHA